jgi:Phage major capsid protein E
MSDIFSTDALVAVVQDLRVPSNGLAARYFGTGTEETTEEVHFDVENRPRRIAPFVSPLVAGKVMQSRGFQTKTFKPAYVKPKSVFTPNRALKRAMGERIGGGQLSPEQRMQLLVVQDMNDHIDMIQRRKEWMAAQVLHSGAVTITGDDYPAALVDFGRAAGHTVTLSGGARWGQAGVKPLDDLQDWSDTMVKNCGVAISEVTMTIDAWKIFRADADVQTRLDRFRANSTLQPDAHKGEGHVFQGMVDQFAIYTYSAWYVDPTSGTETAMLPANSVICTGAPDQVEGISHHGAILDHDSLQAMAYFPKSWVEPDPSVRFLLTQSAPLLVPYRVNATFRATVN